MNVNIAFRQQEPRSCVSNGFLSVEGILNHSSECDFGLLSRIQLNPISNPLLYIVFSHMSSFLGWFGDVSGLDS